MTKEHLSLQPVVFWFRNDLRLSDNPALVAAVATGQPVIPVYILDDVNPGIWRRGAASRWWLHHSLKYLSDSLVAKGFHPLVLLKGDAEQEIQELAAGHNATAVFWNRRYEPWATALDARIKQSFKEKNIEASSFGSFLMFEPWQIKNKTGLPYRVFTPFSKACAEYGGIRPPLANRIKPVVPTKHVPGLALAELGLMPDIKWYKNMEADWRPGEDGAKQALSTFLKKGIGQYKDARDYPATEGVSRLSPHLHFGEISPHQVWHAVSDKMAREDNHIFSTHAQGFLRQLIWREFSWHLLFHTPDFPEKPWNKQFEHFEWKKDEAYLEAWKKGLTGYPIVDAGMRQLWQTGWMHNRLRMIAGSFLVKNLLQHWRDGEDWFWDTLVDADLGNNASGWQWIAGCGADASPYFRIFNPLLQSRKFDGDGKYIRRFLPELAKLPDEYLHAPWEAPEDVLKKAGITLGKTYPRPIVDLAASRDRALEAYGRSKR